MVSERHNVNYWFIEFQYFFILCILKDSNENGFSKGMTRLLDNVRNLRNLIIFQERNVSELVEIIHYQNNAQEIHNFKKFGPMTNNTVLITIQVHDRISYLIHLIDSLRRSSNISEALIIFSHDIYDDQINDLIQSIDFCMVMQIFLPYSNQLNPVTFPGDDPNDCKRNDTFIKAKEEQCNNWKYPDTYGHYRESKYTQMKHHWWWKLNRIFDELEATKYYQGFLLLLEEDYYVAEDFIHVFRVLQNTLKTNDFVNILTLGAYDSMINNMNFNSFNILSWKTDKHNMAMSFNRTTWNSIKQCSKYFCEYDEYNYDFSLQNINKKCLKNKLITGAMNGARVFHIGFCGVHQTSSKCEIDDKILQMEKSLKKAKLKNLLYPKNLKADEISTYSFDTLINNGGWADKRDQQLCMKMTKRSENENH